MAEPSQKLIVSIIRRNLIHKRDKLIKSEKRELENFSDPNNRLTGAGLIFQRESDDVSVSISTNHREQINAINRALENIQLGTYGICQECNTAIPLSRLEVMPHAKLCIKCQSAKEKN